MDDQFDRLLESERQMRVFADWLMQPLKDYANNQLWHGDTNTFFFETDDEVYALERTDSSLRVELVGTP